MADYTGRVMILNGNDECRVTAKLGYGQLYRIEHSDGTIDTIPTNLLKQCLNSEVAYGKYA